MKVTGPLKVLRVQDKYILFLDFDTRLTNTLHEMYKLMMPYDVVDILDTGVSSMDLGAFEYVTSELAQVFCCHKYTLVDIVYIVKHAIEFWKKRRDFLKLSRERHVAYREQEGMSNKDYVYYMYNRIFKKVTCIRCEEHVMKRFMQLGQSCLMHEFEKCLCLPCELYDACVRVYDSDVVGRVYENVEAARQHIISILANKDKC